MRACFVDISGNTKGNKANKVIHEKNNSPVHKDTFLTEGYDLAIITFL